MATSTEVKSKHKPNCTAPLSKILNPSIDMNTITLALLALTVMATILSGSEAGSDRFFTPIEIDVFRCADRCMVARYNCDLDCSDGANSANIACINTCSKVERDCRKKCD
ncbi:hypothetical protein LSAT2_003279 [Lamellibrachia satsuma]|nr:hypothetical protein LSAT2_003279 [Lamellibrachia satsuma]